MALWQSILLLIAALIVAAILIEMFLKRNQPRPPLAKQFLGEDHDEKTEDKPELGMEAVDFEVLRASERGNKSAAALGARDMQFWSRHMQFGRRPKDKPKSAGKAHQGEK